MRAGGLKSSSPTVDGCLNIMRSAIRAGVRDIVICSSTSSTNPVPSVPFKNEVDHWSDPDQQCADKKYTSATKAVMERQAMALAAEHGVRLSILLPTGMFGPMVLPKHGEEGFMGALKRMLRGREGAARHSAERPRPLWRILRTWPPCSWRPMRNPTPEGRYFAVRESWHWKRHLPNSPRA